jgi:RNA polymerase sigma factor (sigma-70 family)
MSPSVSIRLLLTQSDTRLVELSRAGHERAFEALVERYRQALLGYCRRQLLPHERAEDALQQGLLQAWLALREGVEVRHVRPWLYSIVHNTALNMRRCGYDYVQLSETLCGADAPDEDLDRRIAVREALAGLAALPEMQREALLHTAVDGSSYQETAVVLGLSEGAVRGLVHRARLALRTAVTAVTPSPLLSWMLGSGGADAPLAGRIAEVGAGSGSAGLTVGLLKLAATAATAGVMVGGIGILRHPHAAQAHRAIPIAPARVDATPVQTAAVHVLTHDDVGYGDRATGAPGERARDRLESSVGSGGWRLRASHRHMTLVLAPRSARARPQPVAPTARGEAVVTQPGVERGASSAANGEGRSRHDAHGGDAHGDGGALNADENGRGRSRVDGTAGNESGTPSGSSDGRQASDDTRDTSAPGSSTEGGANGGSVQRERQQDASSSYRQEQESRVGLGNEPSHEGAHESASVQSSTAGEAGEGGASARSGAGGGKASEAHN